MADLEMLFKAVDELTPAELNQLHDYVEQKRKASWSFVPPENLAEIAEITRPVQEEASYMSEKEINTAIDEAIAEVRREHKVKQSEANSKK